MRKLPFTLMLAAALFFALAVSANHYPRGFFRGKPANDTFEAWPPLLPSLVPLPVSFRQLPAGFFIF